MGIERYIQLRLVLLSFWITAVTSVIEVSASDVLVEYGKALSKNENFLRFNISKMLKSKGDIETAIVQNIQGVIDRLEEASTCGTEAALHLFEICQNVSNESSDYKAQIEDAKTLYSVRMAVCETVEGGALIPRACSTVMSTIAPGADRQSMVDADTKYLGSKALPACVHSLQQEHYYWTSYSNHRQDAGTLCDTSRAEVEKRRLLLFYREITGSMHGISQVMHDQMLASNRWLDSAEHRAFEIEQANQRAMLAHAEQLDKQALRAMQGFEAIESAAIDNTKAMLDTRKLIHDAHIEANKIVSDLGLTSPTIRANIARMFADASQELIMFTQEHTDQVDVAKQAIKSLSDMLTAGHIPKALNNLKIHVESSVWTAQQALAMQQDQTMLLEKHRQILSESLELQQSSEALATDVLANMQVVSNYMALIASPLRALSTIWTAYEQYRSTCCISDVALLGLFTSSSSLLLLIPGYRRKGLCLLLSYCSILCFKTLMTLFKPLDKFRRLSGAFTQLVSFQNPDILFATAVVTTTIVACSWTAFARRSMPQSELEPRLVPKHSALWKGSSMHHNHNVFQERTQQQFNDRWVRARTAPPQL